MLENSRKKYIFAFLFYAIYSSIIFGIVFLVNDYLDGYFNNKDDNKLKKTGLHVISILVLVWMGTRMDSSEIT